MSGICSWTLIALLYLGFSSCQSLCEKCKLGRDTQDHMEIMALSKDLENNPHQACDECIEFLLSDLVDYRTSTHLRFNGSSVYVRKIRALEKISGIPSGTTVNSVADAVIINQYLVWAKENRGIDIETLCLAYHDFDSLELVNNIVNLNQADWSESMLHPHKTSSSKK